MTEQLIAEGQTGSEPKYMIERHILEPYQVDEYREALAGSPRKLAQFNKKLFPITETWTWHKQASRFSPLGYDWVRVDVKYLDAQGKQI